MKLKSAKKIAIFRTDRIGEVLLSTIIPDAVKRTNPQSEIIFVTSKYASDLLHFKRSIDDVLGLNPFTSSFIGESLILARTLKTKKIDAAIILNPHKVLHLACFFAGIPVRIGYNRKWGFLLTDKMRDGRDNAVKHEVDYNRDVLEHLSIPSIGESPHLEISRDVRQSVRNKLEDQGINADDDPIIVIHPCASNPDKLWGNEKYAQLIKMLKESHAGQIVVIGEEKEKEDTQKIIDASKVHCLNAAGLFDLKELAGLLSLSAYFIGNDSGPMHLAAALDIQVISIFSKKATGSNPVRWAPYGRHHAVFHELYGEKPCTLNQFTGYYIANNEILPKDVFEMYQTFSLKGK